MKHHCFTSFTFSYLAKARVLAHSIKRHIPDWVIWALITDEEPEGFTFSCETEPFDRVMFAKDLAIENIDGWIFGHDIVEICTAVKGPFMKYLTEQEGVETITYLDPDTCLFESLNPIIDMLDDASILLTPHQLGYDNDKMSILDNEFGSLNHGIYNLGYISIRNDSVGKQFAQWWSDRLTSYCHDDKPRGLFVDQKWCDLVPALFPRVHIIRDPGYNVASWNLNQRTINIDHEGKMWVNGSYPLRFYHYTKLGVLGDRMTERYANDNLAVYELWSWYKRQVERYSEKSIPDLFWAFSKFKNNRDITREMRTLYRERGDLQNAFPNPWRTGENSYLQWFDAHH